jgi:hypothetical protein
MLALRILTIAIGGLGLFWGIANVARGEASDGFRDTEARLLRFEGFSRASTIATLKSETAQALSACDNHAQRALMLMKFLWRTRR